MTLLIRMLGELAVSAALWAAAITVIAFLGGIVVHATAGRDRPVVPTLLAAALGGAAIMAIAHRLGAPDPLALTVFGRDLLPSWTLAGALAAALLVTGRRSGTTNSTAAART